MEKITYEELRKMEYYHAMVFELSGRKATRSWGFYIRPKKCKVFTIRLALEILDSANEEYKKIYGEGADFNYIIVESKNMEKRMKYWRDRNRLLIAKDGVPVYENNNGVICRDSEALADCLADGLEG